jgi:hypothetical protein
VVEGPFCSGGSVVEDWWKRWKNPAARWKGVFPPSQKPYANEALLGFSVAGLASSRARARALRSSSVSLRTTTPGQKSRNGTVHFCCCEDPET